MQRELGTPLFVGKQSKPFKKRVVSLRCFVYQVTKEYERQLRGWFRPHLAGEAFEEAYFLASRKEIYRNLATARIMRVVATGRLKAFVAGDTPAYILQAQPSFWQPQEDASNADALLTGVVSANPFGMEFSLDLPAEVEGKKLCLSSGKATGWLKQSPKLHRINAPDALLKHWYNAIGNDDPTKCSLDRLRSTARKDLRMRVSEAQIDRLVADEGRKPGRPTSGKTRVAA